MNVLVCIKRVPDTGALMRLTPDEQEIDARHLGFTISPHEECALEEALRIVAAHGGSSAVLTLGPPEAVEQLQAAVALGIERPILLEMDGGNWDASATAAAIAAAVRAEAAAGHPYDLLLFGNESADAGGFQVGIRVAHALGLPCVTGVKALEIADGTLLARRESTVGTEEYEVPLPSVLTVKEGINLPRYPSIPGRLKAKKTPIERMTPEPRDAGLVKLRLRLPTEEERHAEILGGGPEAAPKVVEVLRELQLIS
jgi:electron transfer flavoprotein beta subunit